jgi:DNA-binding CsgD family transcriptional regulator
VSTGAWLLGAEAIAQAATIARRRGAVADAASLGHRVDELSTRCQGAATPALARADGLHALTPREREVVTLAGRGLRSKEVAAHLGVSVRTVDNLLLRAYRKLGVHGRDGLRALLDPVA